MQIREIAEGDIESVQALLCEGFPRRSTDYWRRGLEHLGKRPKIADYPRYGFLIDADDSAQGVILMLTADFGQGPRSNLSSWYVRPAYRKYAMFLYQRALKGKAGTYLNLTPSPNVLPIVKAFGFKPYTAGTILLGPGLAARRSGRVARLDRQSAKALELEASTTAEVHLGYGCAGLMVEDVEGSTLALYRVKRLKRLVPAAQFVAGAPERLLRNAGGLMRALLADGIPIALIDAPREVDLPAGRLLKDRAIRYWRGIAPPAPGDLRATELAVFGP